MFNFNIPFFRPLWIRIVTVLVCFAWAGVELANGATVWAMLFVGLGGFVGYQMFFNWSDPDDPDDPDDRD
jgi:hypothetical protein